MDRPSRSGAHDTLGPCTAPGPTTARPRTAPVKRMQVMGPFNSGTTLMHRYQNRLWRLANRHHGIAWKHSLPPAYRWQERSLWSQEEGGPSQELLESTVITCMVRLPYFWLTSTARDSYGLDLLDGGTWFGERIRSRVRLGEHTFENMVQLWNAYYGAYAQHLEPHGAFYVRLEDLVQAPTRVLHELASQAPLDESIDVVTSIREISSQPAKSHGRPCVHGDEAKQRYTLDKVRFFVNEADRAFINAELDRALMERFGYPVID